MSPSVLMAGVGMTLQCQPKTVQSSPKSLFSSSRWHAAELFTPKSQNEHSLVIGILSWQQQGRLAWQSDT